MLWKSSKSSLHSVVIIFLLCSSLFTVLSFHSSATASPSGIVIPLYTYPTDGTWSTVAQTAESYPNVPIMAVINPDSGPGSSFDQNYANGIALLQSAGVIVLGYVDTAFATDSISSVESEVNQYLQWYPTINGIMFDDMSNAPGNEGYYSTLDSYAQSLGLAITMGNPGTSVPSAYVGTLNVLCVQEGAGLLTPSSLSTVSSGMGYAKSNFAYIAYATSLPNETYLAGVSNDVQWLYMTDATLPNPYDVLPSYFTSLVAEMSEVDSASATVTVTVNSAYTNGTLFGGMWTTVESGGNSIASGYTPLEFDATVGSQYVVTVDNYQNYTFTQWTGGSTNASITISPTQETSLAAYFSTGSSEPAYAPLAVESAALNGTQFSGMWTEVAAGDQIVDSGYTPLVFNATVGATYSVAVSNYGDYIFNYWQGGGTDSNITITPSQQTTLIAYYSTPVTTTTTTQTATSTTSPPTNTTTTTTQTTSTTSATQVTTTVTQTSQQPTTTQTVTTTSATSTTTSSSTPTTATTTSTVTTTSYSGSTSTSTTSAYTSTTSTTTSSSSRTTPGRHHNFFNFIPLSTTQSLLGGSIFATLIGSLLGSTLLFRFSRRSNSG